MKHPFLHPVDPGHTPVPICYDALQAWVDRLPGWFADPAIPNPKATLLGGLPGIGKAIAVKAFARMLRQPLFRLDPACDASALAEITRLLQAEKHPCVLWIDQPGDVHVGIHRWLLDVDPSPAFVTFTTNAPQMLPPGFTRADVVESVWHLDLPNVTQRSTLWGELLAAANPGYHEHDSVTLGQMSPMFTPGEIRAAYENATREAGQIPEEGQLIDAVLALRPVALSMDEQLACLRAWARAHALEAAAD
jgi:hypothetical protein